MVTENERSRRFEGLNGGSACRFSVKFHYFVGSRLKFATFVGLR